MTQDELRALWEQSTPQSQTQSQPQSQEELRALWEQSAPSMAEQPAVTPPSSPSAGRPSFYGGKIAQVAATPEQEAFRQERLRTPFTAVGEAFENLMTFGQAPKIKAFAASLLPGREYEQELQRYLGERQIAKEAQPGVYKGTQMFAPAGLIGRAAAPAGFLTEAVALPAVESAFGQASQAAEAGEDILPAATLGAAGGAVLGPVGYGAGKAIQGAANRVFGPDKATRIVKESLDENIPPEEAIERLRAGGSDYMIGDLIPEATYQVQAKQGPARQRIRQALESRQRGDIITGAGGQKEQFKNIMNDFTGSYDENFYSKLRRLREEKSEISNVAYEKSFKDPINPTQEMIKVAETPLGRQAYAAAQRSWQNEMMTPNFPYANIKDITDLRFWNNFKKELDQLADYTPAGQRIFKKADRSPDNVNASRMAKTVRDSLIDQSENYAQALQANRNFQQMDEGMRLGKDIYRMKTDEIEDKMANLTVPKDAVKMGNIQAIKEQVQQMMDTGNVGRKVTRNDNFKAVLKQVIPDKKEYAQFINQIQKLEDQAFTYARTMRTVPTAENIRAIEQAEGAPGPLAELANLNLGAAVRQGLGMVGRPTLPREEIADILLQQGPQAIQTLQRMYSPRAYVPADPGFLGQVFGLGGTQSMLQQ